MSAVSRLSLNQKLAALALVLGLVAVFAHPVAGGSVNMSPKELALVVSKEVDHVDPLELADWIVAGRSDFRLVDLRDAQAYAQYHIPGAENVPLASLPDAGLLKNERIVVYSDGGIHSAQGWFLMRAKGYRGVYILRGGLDDWKDLVLFPAASGSTAGDATRAALAAHFGGALRSGSSAAASSPAIPALPKIDAPVGSSTSEPAAGGKKKKEGC